MSSNALTTYRLVAWDDLPTMPIYMDQLLQLVNQMLAPLRVPTVTKTMVNSYVKQHFFSRPTGHRYTRNHVVAVIVVSLLKADFPLAVISRAILMIRDSRKVALRYTQFCQAFELSLRMQPLGASTDETERVIQLAAQTVASHVLTIRLLG